MNECLQRLQTELDNAGLQYEVLNHPVGYTAQHEAAAAHVPGHCFAKSVVVFADTKPAQLVLPAPHQVDFEAIRGHLGVRDVSLANEEALLGLFPDSEAGAMPPIPGREGVPVYVDRELAVTDTIVFDAGSHTDSVKMATRDYLRLVDPPIFEFGTERIRPNSQLGGVSSRGSEGSNSPLPHWALRSGLMAGLSAIFLLVLSRFARLPVGKQILAFIAGNATGAAALAFTDARSGGRRRALVRDKGRKYSRQGLRRLRGLVTRVGGAVKGKLHGGSHAARRDEDTR